MTSCRDCQYLHVFLYMLQSVILKYSDIIASNPEATLHRLWLLGTSSFFSHQRTAESQQQPMSWRSGSNAAFGNAEPRGIQRLRLFRQSQRTPGTAALCLQPGERRFNDWANCWPTGRKLGTETQEEEQEPCAHCHRQRSTDTWLSGCRAFIFWLSAERRRLLSFTLLWCYSESFTVYIQSDNNRKPSVTATATVKWGAIS